MKTLVTGGAGFIGCALIDKLQGEGDEIFLIDNLSFGKREFINVNDNRFFLADILDESTIDNIFNTVRPDRVIHLAAVHFIPYCNQHPFESSNINIRGTIHVLNACKNIRLKVFLLLPQLYIQSIMKLFLKTIQQDPWIFTD